MTDAVIARKIERLASGKSPRVLDLFSGCGGISLGFQRAGFQIDAAVEFDPLAALSHATNFHRQLTGAAFEVHAKARDITQTEPGELASELGLGEAAEAFDILVGGPPCQAYARVGRAKLRDVAQHPEAFRVDARGNLYLRYLHFVRETKPLALLMENVPDIMNYGGHNVVAEIAETLEDMGYIARYTLLNASRFGVPQMRDRVILLALHKSLGAVPSFPPPTRHVDLPPGYSGTRAVAFKNIDPDAEKWFVAEPTGAPNLLSALLSGRKFGCTYGSSFSGSSSAIEPFPSPFVVTSSRNQVGRSAGVR